VWSGGMPAGLEVCSSVWRFVVLSGGLSRADEFLERILLWVATCRNTVPACLPVLRGLNSVCKAETSRTSGK
jgi:hypothetical protein